MEQDGAAARAKSAPAPEHASGAPEGGDVVLLALIELAREQASELAAQNEALRRRNDELARANRHRAEFLTTMSHELRTPLNAILGFSELLAEETHGPLRPLQAEYVADIRRAGENLLTLINDVLDMAKIDAGRMAVRREPLDLVVPVTEAVDLVRGLAARKEQRLELRAFGLVPCLGDTQRLRQVTLNLLGNAVKFTPPGGAVTVSVDREEGGARLEVRDTGIGIDPRDHAAIFEAFRQLDAGETRAYPGTGLGLALVARFIEAMGGTVSVDSRLGRGAAFTVRLPAPDGGTR